jgi:DNA-binding NarL/FixJ family response regulator
MAGSIGRRCTTTSIGVPSHHRDPSATRIVRTLLLEDDPKAKERIVGSILLTPTEVTCVPTSTAALSSLDDNLFDIILIDRHLGGWVSAQSCKGLVSRAGGRPVVGLIDEDCVLDLRDGIEAGLTAVYYRDEMNFRLMRRLVRLAVLPSVDTPLTDAAAPPFRLARSSSERAGPR